MSSMRRAARLAAPGLFGALLAARAAAAPLPTPTAPSASPSATEAPSSAPNRPPPTSPAQDTSGGSPEPPAPAGQAEIAPPAATAAPAAPPPSATPTAPSATPPAPIDVLVTGTPHAPGTISLGKGEVRVLPGAFGDPFRAIEAMPGVTAIASGAPYFYVRGAPPGNVGYFLDGVRVPALFHILAGPAVVPPALIERVELFPGGYPAQYGRFAGGIVAGKTRAPSPELRAEATLRLIDAGALVEAPLPGGLGSALAGARYSYTAPVLSLFVSNLRFEYWDYQGRVALDLSPTRHLTVFAFGSHDNLEQRFGSTWYTLYASEFHRVDLRYDAEISDRTRIEQAITLGVDHSTASVDEIHPTTVRSVMLDARTQIRHRLTDGVLLRGGLDAELDSYHDEGIGLVGLNVSLLPNREDIVVGAFADAVIDAGRGVQITPGARVDLWNSQGTTAFSGDVRFAVRAPVTPRVRLTSAAGLAHQAPGFALQVPGVAVGGLRGGLQSSFQTSGGVEVDLPLDITGSATFFYNAFFNLSDPMGISGRLGGTPAQPGVNRDLAWLNERALGSAVGMEIYLRRKLTRRLGGFLAYTLSRSTRYVGKETFAAQFDRTHSLGAALSWDIGGGFRVGSRVTFYTGTPLSGFYPKSTIALIGADRLPPFFRLDVRGEKRFLIGERHWISIVLEVQNATLAREPNGVQCTSAPQTCQVGTIGPFTLPSLGVEGAL